ncbi:MAG: phage head closure protein [Pseudomonadota bacterium]
MAAVASGDLRHKVQIQEPGDPTQDPNTGEQTFEWETVASVWAQIVPMSGREFIAASAEQSEVQGRIVIRYREGVDATMRIVYRNKYYNIKAVLPDAESGKEHLTLMVSEGVTLGQ